MVSTYECAAIPPGPPARSNLPMPSICSSIPALEVSDYRAAVRWESRLVAWTPHAITSSTRLRGDVTSDALSLRQHLG